MNADCATVGTLRFAEREPEREHTVTQRESILQILARGKWTWPVIIIGVARVNTRQGGAATRSRAALSLL